MPRPGLIIGLGGTGQWVLTWLKRDLLLSNNGRMPDNVRLIEIDTATRLEAGASRVTSTGQRETAVELGDVTLSEGEFIYVGGNSRPIAERVREGKLKQIGLWYQADKWLTSQSPATFILDDGAGRLRQFGRMAVFKDLLGQDTNSRLWRSLRNALDGVRARTSEQRRLEVIVVGSFAGGTGSGMFIDIALILRMLAKQLNIHHILRGYFALPSVFDSAPDKEMRARSLAAWRELNRFMVVDPDFPMPWIEYVENAPSFRIRPEQRIFDACYLVDGKRKGQPLAEEPKYGVFPMMAEAISAILDEEAGTAYTQWVTQNLAPEYSRRPDLPMYSAIGAFTVQVPAHFIRETSSHDYAQKLLLKLLSPTHGPDENGRLEALGAKRHLALAAPDQNMEDPHRAGRERRRRILTEGVNYEGVTSKPSLFDGRIARILDEIDQGKAAGLIEQMARAGGATSKEAAAAYSWVSYFPRLGEDPQFKATQEEVGRYMDFSVRKTFGRKEGMNENDVQIGFRKIPETLREYFGGMQSSATSDTIQEDHGKCGLALRRVMNVQVQIFRQQVQMTLLDLLNGHSENPIVARSGKLGYVWDYFDGLATDLDEILNFMTKVKHRRDEIKPENEISGQVVQKEKGMTAASGKRLFWIMEHPEIKQKEAQFLLAQDRLMDVRREDLLHYYVVETARSMKEIAIEARDCILRWIQALSTGDDASQVIGLWDGVRLSRREVDNAHSYDQHIDKVQMIVAEDAPEINDAEVEAALRRWSWRVDYLAGSNGLQIQAQIEADGEIDTLVDPALGGTPEEKLIFARENQNALLSMTGRQFSGVVARTTAAEAIKKAYPKQPGKFATDVAVVSAEPLFDGDPEASPRKKTNLIRVMIGPNDPYFVGENGVEGALRKIYTSDSSLTDDTFRIQVVNSENPFKLTLVRTDDLYPYTDYAAWGSCMEAYAAHMETEGQPLDPVLMQNFAAERRAVEYERRLKREKGLEYRPLHPRVVMLLEDPRALKQFVYLGMMGLIAPATTRNMYRWQLTWTREDSQETFWLTRPWNEDVDLGNRVKPDIMNAIHGYVIEHRTQEPRRDARISFDYAQRLIDAHVKKLGPKGEAKLIKDNMKGGLIAWLNKMAYEYPEEKEGLLRADFADLALVIEMILRDRLQELEPPKEKRRELAEGESPFATFTPEKKSRSSGVAKKTGTKSTPTAKTAAMKPPEEPKQEADEEIDESASAPWN